MGPYRSHWLHPKPCSLTSFLTTLTLFPPLSWLHAPSSLLLKGLCLCSSFRTLFNVLFSLVNPYWSIIAHYFSRKGSLVVKNGCLYLLIKPHLWHTHNLKITERHIEQFLLYETFSSACVLSCPKLSFSPHPSPLQVRKARWNFTYFHVLAAEVVEEELAGQQDCWGWLGSAGPEDSAGPSGSASLS